MTKAHEPFNLDAEKALLCALLREPNCIEAAASISGPAEFSQSHAPIYLRLMELWQSGENPDLVTVMHSLKEHGELEAVGGPIYLSGLLDVGAIGANARSYAELVRKSADGRRALEAIKTALKNVSNGSGADPYDAIRALKCELERLTPRAEKSPHAFTQITDDRFNLTLPEVGITFEVDRLRREHNELVGELCVRCKLPGVSTYDGALSIADLNISSARSRTERAGLLAKRANIKDLDWPGYLEEFCQRVLEGERQGQPAVDLREIPKPEGDDSIFIEGMRLPKRHPTILFGDGGAAKSYTALYLAGRMVEQGLNVALFDWELAGEDHRERLERLFGKEMPRIIYARCERPLVYELDRLRRIARDKKIDFAFYDSVAFACDGPPEAAEIAGKYFRAVRQIGGGSLHVAHITKADGGDQKPFGSVFWHNGARATYYIKLAEESPDGDTLQSGIFNRKVNLGRIHPPTGFKIAFTQDRTYFAKTDPADTPDLADKMSIRERMRNLLKHGSMSVESLAEEMGTEKNSIYKSVHRNKRIFTLLEGGKVALLQQVTR
jgi:hypothetical protein